jgi:hypothetical protein
VTEHLDAFLARARERAAAAEPVGGAVNIRFAVDRGSFTVPGELFEEGREGDLARHWARALDGRKVTIARKEVSAGGDVVVHWRHVRTIVTPA